MKKDKDISPLDQMAMGWQKNEDAFYASAEISKDFLEISLLSAKNNLYQIEKHDILKSKNLETIFDQQYRTKEDDDFLGYYEMTGKIFNGQSLPPLDLDLGTVRIHSNEKITDVISGFSNNMGQTGFLISSRLMDILKEYQIGSHQFNQNVEVHYKRKKYQNYGYFYSLYSMTDFVDYSTSIFYANPDYFDYDKVEFLKVKSLDDLQEKRDKYYEERNIPTISSKELFLHNLVSKPDLFFFKRLGFINFFASVELAKTLVKEKITGFNISETSKVKIKK